MFCLLHLMNLYCYFIDNFLWFIIYYFNIEHILFDFSYSVIKENSIGFWIKLIIFAFNRWLRLRPVVKPSAKNWPTCSARWASLLMNPDWRRRITRWHWKIVVAPRESWQTRDVTWRLIWRTSVQRLQSSNWGWAGLRAEWTPWRLN